MLWSTLGLWSVLFSTFISGLCAIKKRTFLFDLKLL